MADDEAAAGDLPAVSRRRDDQGETGTVESGRLVTPASDRLPDMQRGRDDMTCFCGEGAIGLIGEDGIPMCLNHYIEELTEASATMAIADQAAEMASRRVHYRPIESVDTGGML